MPWGLFGRWRKRQERRVATTPQEQLKQALCQLRERLLRGKRRRVDDFHEVVIDGAETTNVSEALLEMTEEAYARRDRSRKERVDLRSQRAMTDETSRREAARAAQELEEEMQELGVKPRDHYYSSSEIPQTGEVDRTYAVEDENKQPRRPDQKKK